MPSVQRLTAPLVLGALVLPFARLADAAPAAPGEAPSPPHRIAV